MLGEIERRGIRLNDRETKLINALSPVGAKVTGEELALLVHHRFSCDVDSCRQKGIQIEVRGTLHWLLPEINDMVSTKSRKLNFQERYYSCRHWQKVRLARLKLDDFTCCNCKRTKGDIVEGKGTLEVHHFVYDLFDERLGDLMSLCDGCHRRMHDNVTIAFPKAVPKHFVDKLDK